MWTERGPSSHFLLFVSLLLSSLRRTFSYYSLNNQKVSLVSKHVTCKNRKRPPNVGCSWSHASVLVSEIPADDIIPSSFPGLAVRRRSSSLQPDRGRLAEPAEAEVQGGAGLLHRRALRGGAGQVSATLHNKLWETSAGRFSFSV